MHYKIVIKCYQRNSILLWPKPCQRYYHGTLKVLTLIALVYIRIACENHHPILNQYPQNLHKQVLSTLKRSRVLGAPAGLELDQLFFFWLPTRNEQMLRLVSGKLYNNPISTNGSKKKCIKTIYGKVPQLQSCCFKSKKDTNDIVTVPIFK